jgi:hypothetical protein
LWVIGMCLHKAENVLTTSTTIIFKRRVQLNLFNKMFSSVIPMSFLVRIIIYSY